MSQSPWIASLFTAIDTKDAVAFAQFLDENVVFRFGNADAAHGRATAQAIVAGFFDSIASLSHDVHDVWETDSAVISHGFVTYTRHNGTTLSVPFCNVFKMNGNLIGEYLIFADVSMLYSV